MLYKLRHGGVQSLSATYPRSAQPYQVPRIDPLLPSLAAEDVPFFLSGKIKMFRLPPLDALPTLKSFYSDTTLPPNCIDRLPPTLTHLDLSISGNFWMSATNVPLKKILPNLLYLGLMEAGYPFVQPSHLLSSIPPGVTALQLRLSDADGVFHCSKMLPPGLTRLDVAHLWAKNEALKPSLLDHGLPSTIISLGLPTYQIRDPDLSFGLISAHLQELCLAEVYPNCFGALPKSLLRLRLTNLPIDSYIDLPYTSWPPKLQTLVVDHRSTQRAGRTALPSPPSITKLQVYGTLTITDKLLEVQRSPSEPLMPLHTSLIFLDFPGCTLLEPFLDILPTTLLNVSLYDVRLTGESLPKNIKTLDSLDDMKRHFWACHRSFHLILYAPLAPTSLEKLQKVPYEALQSLKLPYHGLQDLSKLPHTLTSLAHIVLQLDQLDFLPPLITHLHIFQPKSAPSFEISMFKDRLPCLKLLASSEESRNGLYRARLRLLPEYLPRELVEAPQIPGGATTSAQPTSSESDSLVSCCLPDDAIRNFFGQEVEVQGFDFDSTGLLADEVPLLAKHLTIKVNLVPPKSLIKAGFAPFLETLELLNSKFLKFSPNGDLLDTEFPIFPRLRHLTLSGPLALAVLFTTDLDPSPSFPPSLTHLTLIFDEEPPYKWRISPRLRTTLLTLEVRFLSKDALLYADISCLDKADLMQIERTEKAPYYCLTAQRTDQTPSTCSVM
jgi:hypothetical protein